MRWKTQRFRWLLQRLPAPDRRRLVVLTGARQVGKTTLARQRYPELRYLNLDAVEDREAVARIRTASWGAAVGTAVIDEAQKQPAVFDKVKYAYDAAEIGFTVLLGSSRFLLMDRVKESLAGRAFVFELWPLMPSEIRAAADASPTRPLLGTLLDAQGSLGDELSALPEQLLGPEDALRRDAIDHLCAWGGMPELLSLDDADRREWLRSYQQTFLERDLVDLVRLSDLQPFQTLQRLVMLRTGRVLSYAELARDAGMGATTARRYLEYLRISYQAVLLPPYHEDLTSALIKSPKIYWVDLGLLRQGIAQWGTLMGEQFETLVVIEIHKWVSTSGQQARLSFYRTRSGLEVDLLLETPHGVIGVEIKQRREVHGKDLRGLASVADAMGAKWRGGLVVYRGSELRRLDNNREIWAMPVHRLF